MTTSLAGPINARGDAGNDYLQEYGYSAASVALWGEVCTNRIPAAPALVIVPA
jgi:hypothetical protein